MSLREEVDGTVDKLGPLEWVLGHVGVLLRALIPASDCDGDLESRVEPLQLHELTVVAWKYSGGVG